MDSEGRCLSLIEKCEIKLNVMDALIKDLKKSNLINFGSFKEKLSECKTISGESQDIIYDVEENFAHVGSAVKRQRILKQVNLMQKRLINNQNALESVIKHREADLAKKKNKKGKDEDSEDQDTKDSQRLADTVERGQSTRKMLDDSWRMIQDSRQQGEAVLMDLENQRDQMKRMYGDLEEIGDVMGDSRGVLSRMARRAIYNKVVLWLMIVVVSAAIFGVIELLYIKHPSHDDPGHNSSIASYIGYLS